MAVPDARMLSEVLGEAGILVPDGAVEKLVRHAAEMLRWNRSIRLTAITEPREVAVKHILDSLFLLRFSPFPGRTLDFGSGAGYPGIPLAVALPDSRLVLLEASGKKCAFLSRVRALLDLPNVLVVRGRLDDRAPLPLGRFEQIVTRATLPPAGATALLAPLLSPGGRLLLMTGPWPGKCPAGDPPTGDGSPGGLRPARTVRFDLPRGMGAREIRELLAP